MINSKMGSYLAVLGTLDPVAVVATEVFTDIVDCADTDEIMAILSIGAMASETVDFKCYYCDSDGSNPIALKSAVQLAAHASNNDNTQLVICIDANQLAASGKRHVKFGVVTGSSSGGIMSIVVIGTSRYIPASGQDLASVQQIVQ